MTGMEAVQLGVCLLFPLSYVGLLLWTTGRKNGRTTHEIATTLAAIVACVLGVVAIGLALTASRGGALFDLRSGSSGRFSLPEFDVADIRAIDVVGIAACVGLLLLALKVSKRLTTPTIPEDETTSDQTS